MRRTRRPLPFPLLALASVLFFFGAAAIGCVDDETNASFDAGSLPALVIDGGVAVVPEAAAPAPETTLGTTPPPLSNQATAKFEFTSSSPGSSFVCALDGATPATCTSPFSAPVGEGAHKFQVAAISVQGAVDATPAEFAWSVDLTLPDTTIGQAPPALDNSVDVTFDFAATEAATFVCSMDGKAPSECVSPLLVTSLTDGAHTFTVTATDAAGNVEAEAASHSWTIDTSLPDTTLTGGPTGIVSANTATFAFLSPDAGAGATFECSLDNAAFTACTSPVVLNGLADGAHTFRVRVIDATANTDPTPATRAWTVDTVAPAVAITGGPIGVTTIKTPTFTFTATGATKTECTIDAAPFAACTSPFTVAGTLADGNHTFAVRATDAANNVTNATRPFTVDTIAPVVTIATGPSGPTNDSTPTFTFTATGATTIECRTGAGAFAPCTSPFTSALLADGNYTLQVRGTDAAGNQSTDQRSFTVDTVAPAVTITSGPGTTNDTTPAFDFTAPGATATQCRIGAAAFAPCTSPFTASALTDGNYTLDVRGIDAANNVGQTQRAFTIDTVAPALAITGGPSGPTNDSTPTFDFTNSAVASLACRIDADPFVACTSPLTSAALAEGGHTFYVRAIDVAGNTAQAQRSFTVDTVPPTVTITGGPSGSTNTAAVSFAFTSGGGALATACRIGLAAFAPCTSPFAAGTLNDGSYTFDVRATDAAGNTATDTRSFTVDTAAPGVAIVSGPSGPTNDPTPSFGFTTSGGAVGTECRLGLAAFAPCTTPYAPGTLTAGSYTVQVRARDAAGNTSLTQRSFTVDLTPPRVRVSGGPGSTAFAQETFTFISEAGSTTVCRIYFAGFPSGAYTPCSSPYVANLSFPGPSTNWTFEVRATDAANNSASAFWNFNTYIIP